MVSIIQYNSNIKGNRLTMACCLFLFLISPLFAHAQTRGTVEVIKDPRIDTIMMRRLEPAKTSGSVVSSDGSISANGYRVQFFTGSKPGRGL
jgi:hypothetical protein